MTYTHVRFERETRGTIKCFSLLSNEHLATIIVGVPVSELASGGLVLFENVTILFPELTAILSRSYGSGYPKQSIIYF